MSNEGTPEKASFTFIASADLWIKIVKGEEDAQKAFFAKKYKAFTFIPYGPFMIAGAVVLIFFNQYFISRKDYPWDSVCRVSHHKPEPSPVERQSKFV